MTPKYHMIVADHRTGANYWCGELAAQTLLAAQCEAAKVVHNHKANDIVHICVRSHDDRDFVPVSSKIICRNEWVNTEKDLTRV
jgi:hypothetical protein